jgi:hypothetical protein
LDEPHGALSLNDQPEEESIESIAYREAGHAVMAYLMVKGELPDSLFALPVSQADREMLVPEFDEVGPDGELSKLAKPTFSLRSLLTVPPPFAGNSDAEGRARGMIHAYSEEYGGDTSGPESKLQEATEHFNELAHQTIRDHWVAVEVMAQHLLEVGELDRKQALEVIEHNISNSYSNEE